MLIGEKVAQAVRILEEFDCDCWITFVRESSVLHDPMLDYLAGSDVTWHSAFIITRTGDNRAIVGQMDKQGVEDLGVYRKVLGYVQGIKQPLLETLKELNPRRIALNFSAGSDASPEERAEAILAYIPAEQYPYLHRMASHAMQVGYDAEADFDFGLEIILDGLERILDESRSD